MPQLQSLTTWLALNACNDTSPSGITDPVTGLTVYVGDMDGGVYIDLTELQANQLSDTAIGTLHAGRYRRVQVDSGATATNVVTGTIGLLRALPNAAGTPAYGLNIVTSFDQGLWPGLRQVVFLNPVTPGNWCFVQESGDANVLMASGATGSIGNILLAASGGAGKATVSSGSPTWATLPTALGQAMTAPASSALCRVLLSLPLVQD